MRELYIPGVSATPKLAVLVQIGEFWGLGYFPFRRMSASKGVEIDVT